MSVYSIEKNIFSIDSLNYDTLEQITENLLTKDGEYFTIENSNISISNRRLVINLFNLLIIKKFNLPIDEKYLLMGDILNDDIMKCFTNIYIDLFDKNKDDDNSYQKIYLNIKWDFWFAINWMNNFAIKYCGEYVTSIDVLNIVKTVCNPEIKEIIETPINKMLSISNIEKELDRIKAELMICLEKLDIDENQLKDLIHLGLVNKGQVGFFIYKIGYRTDVDDTTIPKLIESNYLKGIRKNIDFILESLADKKSRLYNRFLMSDCQYDNRKNQLAVYNIKNIYQGDCGSEYFVDFLVSGDNFDKIIGKYYWDEKELKCIDSIEDARKLINKSIKMRSPVTCLYRDGVCTICGGKLISRFIQREFNLGNTMLLEYFQGTSQKVLSSKHFQETTSREYVVPEELKPFFKKRKKQLYLKPELKNKDIFLGFELKNCRDILNISDNFRISESEIFESNFGRFRTISIKVNDEILIAYQSLSYLHQLPTLTKKFILYLFKVYKSFEVDKDIIWIPVKDFDFSSPIFSISTINYSIKMYYDRINRFTTKKINKYHNYSMLLEDFSGIVFERSNINIVYLEIILKSFLIRNRLDMSNVSIEEYGDKEPMFGTINNIAQYRNIGSALAFQEHHNFLRDPTFFLVPKDLSPFDLFLNVNFDNTDK